MIIKHKNEIVVWLAIPFVRVGGRRKFGGSVGVPAFVVRSPRSRRGFLLFDFAGLAKETGYNKSQIGRSITGGRLPFLEFDGKKWFLPSDVERWFNEQKGRLHGPMHGRIKPKEVSGSLRRNKFQIGY